MTSFLRVCLGLHLVYCVHGQGSVYEERLATLCASDAYNQYLNCSQMSNTQLATAEQLCAMREQLQREGRCKRAVLYTCLDKDNYGLIQTEARTQNTFEFVCENKRVLALACVEQQVVARPCYTRAFLDYDVRAPDLVSNTCRLLNDLAYCYDGVGLTCPSHSRNFYALYWKSIFPPACDEVAPLARSRVDVPSAADRTKSNTPSMEPAVSLLFLSFGASAVALNKMTVDD